MPSTSNALRGALVSPWQQDPEQPERAERGLPLRSRGGPCPHRPLSPAKMSQALNKSDSEFPQPLPPAPGLTKPSCPPTSDTEHSSLSEL